MNAPVTTPEQRAGLLTAVITGGRPLLQQRPTAKMLPDLTAAGFRPPVWVVSDQHAPAYERDGHDLCVYPDRWAREHAAAHWMLPTPPPADGFLGAFPGREWACREAERLGCWGVLMLDDNIISLRFWRGTGASIRVVHDHGGLALYADLLAALSLSTNARMLGAQLNAVIPSGAEGDRLLRPGFPYSLFIERVGESREEWHGPYEDDITHAFQYGDRWDGATAAVTPLLTYIKEHASKTAMRAKYDSTRAVQLQRLMPQGASIGIRATKSNGKGDPRVFHSMRAGAIRNPIRVHDPALYGAARDRVQALRTEWYRLELESNRDKIRRRSASFAKKQQEAAS